MQDDWSIVSESFKAVPSPEIPDILGLQVLSVALLDDTNDSTLGEDNPVEIDSIPNATLLPAVEPKESVRADPILDTAFPHTASPGEPVEADPILGTAIPRTINPEGPEISNPSPEIISEEQKAEGLVVLGDMLNDLCDFFGTEVSRLKEPTRRGLVECIDRLEFVLDQSKGLLHKIRCRLSD
jgi:hypothetical protein